MIETFRTGNIDIPEPGLVKVMSEICGETRSKCGSALKLRFQRRESTLGPIRIQSEGVWKLVLV